MVLRHNIITAQSALRSILGMVKYAQNEALKSFVNSWAMKYKNTREPSQQAQLMRQLSSQPMFGQWMEKVAHRTIQSLAPQLPVDVVEDLASEAILTMFKSNALQAGIDSWDGSPDGRSFYNWLYNKISGYARGKLSGHYKKINGGPEQDMMNNALSLDDPVPQKDKYSDGDNPNPNMPSFMDYRQLQPQDDNRELLERINNRLRRFEGITPTPNQTIEKNALLRLKSEITQRLQVDQRSDKRFLVDGAWPKRYPDGTLSVQQPRFKKEINHEDLQDSKSDIASAYGGLGDYYVDNLYKKKFHAPGIIGWNIKNPDPTVTRTIAKAMINALMHTKILYDKTVKPRGGSKAGVSDLETGASTKYTAKGMRVELMAELQRQMTSLGVAPEHQRQMLERVSRIADPDLRAQLGVADEAMRFYNYEQGRIKHGQGKEWNQLGTAELQKIQQETMQALNYGPDTNAMYARRLKPNNAVDAAHSAVNLGRFDNNEVHNFIGQELNNHAQGKTGLGLPHSLPGKSNAFWTRENKPVATQPLAQDQEFMTQARDCGIYMQRIASTVKSVNSLLAELESLGSHYSVDNLTRITRVAQEAVSNIRTG